MPEDLYELLGVARDADLPAMKRAFRARVKELHPDKNPGSAKHEARFKAVSRAYAVLTDPRERAAYDRKAPARGRTTAKVTRVRVAPGASPEPLRGPTNGLEMLESFFRKKAPPDEPGEDRHAAVTVALGDALRGTTLALEGLGEGTTEVAIPRGTVNGDRVRVLGAGEPSRGLGRPGDLWLEIVVEPHPGYHVAGRDLHVALVLTVAEAYLGTTVPIATPTGAIDLRIPPRTSSGTVLRVKDRGVPARGDERPGALLVTAQVALPTSEDPEILRIFERLAALDPGPPRRPFVL